MAKRPLASITLRRYATLQRAFETRNGGRDAQRSGHQFSSVGDVPAAEPVEIKQRHGACSALGAMVAAAGEAIQRPGPPPLSGAKGFVFFS